MLRKVPINFPISCLYVALFSTTGLLLPGDDKAPQPDANGYVKMPFVSRDGTTTYLRVKQQLNPYRNVRASGSPGKYEPSSIDFSKTSSMANKSFSDSESPLANKSEAFDSREQRTFITKSYFTDETGKDAFTQNSTSGISAPALTAYSHGVSGLDKSYSVTSTDGELNKSAPFTTKSSELQGRTANLGSEKTDTFASPLGHKAYLGPESVALHQEMTRVNDGLIQLKDLPDRPLTIDEVRELINHGVTPDTDVKPEPPSKPLNDPDYKPEPSPAPPAEEDSGDGVPSPGTMAAQAQPAPPENGEPLPAK